jgi:hypothetical protein
MLEKLVLNIVEATGSPALAVFLISMLPLVELKGGIPFGVVGSFNLAESFLFAYLGSTFAMLPVYILLRPLLTACKKCRAFRSLAERVERLVADKGEKIAQKSGSRTNGAARTVMAGVFCFVALPLPLTGVWMGTAIAVFLGLKFFPALISVAAGNLVAGGIIALITYCFADYADIILLALGIAAAIGLAVTAVRLFGRKKRENEPSRLPGDGA